MPKSIDKVELFAVGLWNGIDFNIADLNAMSVAFHKLKDNHRVPLKFGHNEDQPMTDGQPALGWLTNVWVEDQKLVGSMSDVPDLVFDAIHNKLYDRVSVELDMGVEYKGDFFPWVLSGVALLGADIPAVNTLESLSAYMSRGEDYNAGKVLRFTRPINTDDEGGESPMTKKTIEQLEAENLTLTAKVESLTTQLQEAEGDRLKFKREADELKVEKEDREKRERAAKFTQAREDLTKRLDNLVKADKIPPAKRESLMLEFKEDDAVLERLTFTVDTIESMSGGAPNVPGEGEQGHQGGQGGDGDEDRTPDVVLTQRAREIMQKNPSLQFTAARRMAMQADPDLANKYINMNDVG